MTQRFRVYLLTLLLGLPSTALAHTPIKGINNFYNGALHPVLVPAHLLLLIALGLLLGQQGLKDKQGAYLAFLLATILGLVGAWFSPQLQPEVIILACSAIIGLLIALSPQLVLIWCSIIGATAGFLLGIDSAQESLSGQAKFVTLFGSGVGIYFFSLYPIALADFLRKKHWKQILLRVLGSWVAASSLLVLALSLRS